MLTCSRSQGFGCFGAVILHEGSAIEYDAPRCDADGLRLFNVVEGLINHHLLELRRVNETAPADQWLA